MEESFKQTEIKEDFYLLDVIGGVTLTSFHSTRPIVAYTSGCMIIVYDLLTDHKINLVHHQHEVVALAFSPPGAGSSQIGGDFLISIDFDRNDMSDPNTPSHSKMCLWNWQKGQCLQEIQIPKSSNSISQCGPSLSNSLTRGLHIVFERVGGLFIVLESGALGNQCSGYRATLWNLNRSQTIEMLSQMELELQNSCLDIKMLSKSSVSTVQSPAGYQSAGSVASSIQTSVTINKLKFLTLENQTIKIWELTSGHAELVKRIQIKQSLKQCVVSELTGYLVVLGDNGRVLILDQEGEFISTIKKEMTFFTAISTAHDKLLLGTDRGTVCVYHIASLQFINEIPYQLTLLQNFSLNSQKLEKDSAQKGDLSIFSLGPPVIAVITTANMRFLFIKYQDQSFVVIDRSASESSQAIMGYSYGHFQQVTGLQWLQQKKALKNLNISTEDVYQKSNNMNSFVTCSQDMSVFIWSHFGDRWVFSFIDVVKGCFDQGLSYQRKLNERSTQHLELTALKMYPRSPFVVIGDNKGTVRVFQVTSEQAMFVSSHQLIEEATSTHQWKNQINEIFITPDEAYAFIAFKSGLICCYDIKNSYNLVGVIEKDAQRFCSSNQLDVRMKVLEADSLLIFGSLRIQDERPTFLNSTLDHDLSNITSTPNSAQYRILSTVSPNCISLQSVQIKGHKLSKILLTQFIIDEGKIAGFDVHPSEDYILVTSNQGRIYLYRIDTGELRGTIRIPLHAKECLIDPSGLYVLIQVPPFSPKHTTNLTHDQIESSFVQANLSTHEKDLERTTLLMFEIGTGRACAELKSIFEVSTFSFSNDGKFLALGSKSGSVCIWALGEYLVQNIKQVLDTVKVQSDFWTNYPIFLDDYNTYGRSEILKDLREMPVDELKQQVKQGNQQITNPLSQPQQFFRSNSEMLLSSQRNEINLQKQMTSEINNNKQQEFAQQPNLQPFYRPPMQNYQDRSIQNSNNQRSQINHSTRQNIQQQQKLTSQSQNKFYRKTFVEDQQIQVCNQPIGYINQSKQQTLRQVSQHNNQSQRQAQIQTANQFTSNPEYEQNVHKGLSAGEIHFRNQQNEQKYSQTSPLSSQNRAQLLYNDNYINPQLQNNNLTKIKDQQDIIDQMNSLKQQQQYIQGIQSSSRSQPEVLSQQTDQKPYQIERSSQIQQFNQPGYLQPVYPQQDKQVFIEQQLNSESKSNLLQYEENMDPGYLQNPFIVNHDNQAQLYAPKDAIPFNMINGYPENGITGPIHNIGSRIKPSEGRQVVQDPIDIDDDVSDHGSESLNHQLQELEGRNKYLNGIRVPTSKFFLGQLYLGFVNDDFLQVHGHDGGEKAYTLERMRKEEKMILNNDFTSQSGTSTYELVEEMYENMNSFDRKLRDQRQVNQDRFLY